MAQLARQIQIQAKVRRKGAVESSSRSDALSVFLTAADS
jgi:hypothetical protein